MILLNDPKPPNFAATYARGTAFESRKKITIITSETTISDAYGATWAIPLLLQAVTDFELFLNRWASFKLDAGYEFVMDYETSIKGETICMIPICFVSFQYPHAPEQKYGEYPVQNILHVKVL